MAPKLYKMDASGPVRAVCMAAKHMDIKLEYIETNLLEKDHLKPEFLKLNPQHTVPTLDDGGKIVWDSHAISVYLAMKYGKDDAVYPADDYKRAVVDQRLHFDSSVLFVLIKSIAGPLVEKKRKTVPDQLVEEVNTAYGFIEKFLEGHKWIAGDDITLADFHLITSFTTLELFVPLDASKYPNTAMWLERAQGWPYYDVNRKGLEDCKAFMHSVMS